ncbi:MAG: cytochrome c3 family protein [Planctomycetota bacterium]|jgi:predicted CXXCH cytochrome family protein
MKKTIALLALPVTVAAALLAVAAASGDDATAPAAPTTTPLPASVALAAAVRTVDPVAPPPVAPPPAAPGARPRGPVDPAGCVNSDCHPNIKGQQQLHGPVSVDACDACHHALDEKTHTFSYARPGAELCTFCHDVDLQQPVIHTPLAEGDCASCHDPHGGPDRTLLKAASPAELCADCHTDVIGENRHVHGPVAAGACSACHDPHASQHEALLFTDVSRLCTECHVSVKTQLSSLRHVHDPAARDCLTCHDGHASNHPMMLHDETQMLCLSCHESIRHAVESATTQHAAVTTERECLNCHAPHGSDFPRLLDTNMRGLCFECHDREITLEDGTKLGNIKKVIDTGTSVHGPIAQDNCAACHQIHGGEHFRLLVQEYPAEFYAPFQEESYALCFSCHDRQLVRDPATTSLTDFRNGDTNLHYLHVNRDRKGRTCRACHETHASTREKHIRDSVPFGAGGWQLPIRFTKNPSGGSCAPGCHRPYIYDRDRAIVYEPAEKPPIWPREDDGDDSAARPDPAPSGETP